MTPTPEQLAAARKLMAECGGLSQSLIAAKQQTDAALTALQRDRDEIRLSEVA